MSRVCIRRKERSAQQRRDDVANKERIKNNEANLISMKNMLREKLGKYYKLKYLIDIARETSKRTVILDRRAKRFFDILLCWICENWGVIEPVFMENVYKFLRDHGVTNSVSTPNLTLSPEMIPSQESTVEEIQQEVHSEEIEGVSDNHCYLIKESSSDKIIEEENPFDYQVSQVPDNDYSSLELFDNSMTQIDIESSSDWLDNYLLMSQQ